MKSELGHSLTQTISEQGLAVRMVLTIGFSEPGGFIGFSTFVTFGRDSKRRITYESVPYHCTNCTTLWVTSTITRNDTLQAPIDIDILLTMSLSITIIFRCLNELQQKSLRVGILSPHSHAHYPRCTRYILFSFVCCDFIMRKMGDPLCVT